MKNITIFLIIPLYFVSCGQDTKYDSKSTSESIIIDKSIEKEAKSKMSKGLVMYENTLIADYFENDELIMSTKGKEKKLPFKSFYYNHNDTIIIDGAYGMFGGFGFSIKIKDGEAHVFHMLASDEYPTYALHKNDSLEFRIEVPCTNTQLTLSKMPELKEREVLYGLVEFESGNYYQSGPLVSNKEIESRKKVRMNMKVYFKSVYLDTDKIK